MAEGLVLVLTGYLAIGLIFGLMFIAFGVNKIDPAAVSGTRGFRLVILPGVAALWPLLLLRWVRRSSPPTEKTAHRRASEADEKQHGENS